LCEQLKDREGNIGKKKSGVWGQDENPATHLLDFIFVSLASCYLAKKDGSSVIIVLMVK